MPKLWITYAWKDNEQQDVDYIAKELTDLGIEVRLDRWSLVPGQRLWEQLDRFISSADESDAWMMFVTPNSLGSEPCREEVAYALDRALSKRGAGFPVIGLFAGPANFELFPAALRTRLCVNLEDPGWKESVRAAVSREAPKVAMPTFAPYVAKVHQSDDGLLLEVRPRSGLWAEFFVGVREAEADKFMWMSTATPGRVPAPSMAMYQVGDAEIGGPGMPTEKVSWHVRPGANASPGVSGFVKYKGIPSRVYFGSLSGAIYFVEPDFGAPGGVRLFLPSA